MYSTLYKTASDSRKAVVMPDAARKSTAAG